MDSKAEYSALSSNVARKKETKTHKLLCLFNTVQVKRSVKAVVIMYYSLVVHRVYLTVHYFAISLTNQYLPWLLEG